MIDRFLFKYENRLSGFRSVTDFRRIKQFISIARATGNEILLAARFKEFLFDDSSDISSLEIGAAKIHREAGNIVKTLSRVREDLQNLHIPEFLGEEELWAELERLLVLIRRTLAFADRRPR